MKQILYYGVLGIVVFAILLSGCSQVSDYTNDITKSNIQTKETQINTNYVDTKNSNWLSVELTNISLEGSNLVVNFKLNNLENETIENYENQNGRDTVWLTYQNNLSSMGVIKYIDEKQYASLSIGKLGRQNIPVLVTLSFEKSIGNKFILTYSPRMWFRYADSVQFFVKYEDNKFTSLSKEDYYNVKIERDVTIPKISYNEMLKLKGTEDVKICTQNFQDDELITCLTILATRSSNPNICDKGTTEDTVLECKRRFLNSYSSQLKTLKDKGIDVLELCLSLPENNNNIGQHNDSCFYEIGRTGANIQGCEYVNPTDKQKTCLELYEANK